MNDCSEIRVLVLRENWVGCTGMSAFDAFSRAGCAVDSISESGFIPLEYQTFLMRAAAKLVRPFAVAEFNRAVLRKVHALRPHLFFVVKGPYIQEETLRAIGELGTRLICFFPDLSFTAFGKYLPSAIRQYHWIFTTKSFGPENLRASFKIVTASYLPHAFDAVVHRPRPVTSESLERYGCDVSFIGKWSPQKERILEELMILRPRLDLKVWGDQWTCLPKKSLLRERAMFRSVTGFQYATAVSCSKINLALLQEAIPGAPGGDQITSRTFHIPACGGLMLHQRTADLLEVFTENENCVCFGDAEELAGKIDHLLADANSRRQISLAGRQVVEKAHSWDHRVQTILERYHTI